MKKSKATAPVEAPASAFSFDSLATVHEGIQDDAPQPNVAAMEAHNEETREKIQSVSDEKDSSGATFNPAIHATNAEGQPSKTVLGKFRKKKGTSKVSGQSTVIAEEHKKAAARAAGYLAADLTIHSAMMLGGPEWTPIGSKEMSPDMEFNEHENLRRAFGDYFEAKNISDFPPGIGLTIALSGYMLPRFAAGKETQTRMAKAKLWVTEKVNAMKRKKKDAAQSNTGDNGVGKDDTSEATGSPVDETKSRSART